MSESKRAGPDHDEIRARLSAWIDDDLEPSERTEVAAHLRSCAACRALVGELEGVRSAARDLPPREPGRDLWPGIRAAMHGTVAGRVGPAPAAVGVGPGKPARGRAGLFLTLPQLAAAALVVLALGMTGGWWLAPVASAGPAVDPASPGEVAGGPAADAGRAGGEAGSALQVALPVEARALDEEAAVLRSDFRARADALDGRTVRTVDDNLAMIDRAIEEAGSAYARSPQSPFLERHLVESYRRKVTYLRDAVAMTSWSADE